MVPMKSLVITLWVFCSVFTAAIYSTARDNYIFCSDMSSDIDDLGALAVLLDSHRKEVINLVASTLSVRDGKGYRVMRHLADYYGNETMRIGVNNSQLGLYHQDHYWVEKYLHRYNVYDFIVDDAVSLITEIVETLDDVVIVVVGPQTNLANVERQQPGVLGQAKKIAVMGGRYPSGLEFNVMHDVMAARIVQPYVAEYYGGEIGYIITGEDAIFEGNSPVRFGYLTYNGVQGRKSWDLLAVMGSMMGSSWFTYVRGSNTFLESGENVFNADTPGDNSYAVYKEGADTQLKNLLNDIIGADIALPPPENVSHPAVLELLLNN